MNKKEALEESIAHWERLLTGEDCSIGPSSCALCDMYSTFDNPCVGCPVYEHTGKVYCGSTPYETVSDLVMAGHNLGYGLQSRMRSAMREELDFLKSLREEE